MGYAAAIVSILAVIFALLASVILGFPIINELEDIRAIQFLGWPPLLLSSFLALLAARLDCRKTFLAVGLLNAASAASCLLRGWEGVANILAMQNAVYIGHRGQNYTSFDLFTVAIIPALIVGASWAAYLLRMRTPRRTERRAAGPAWSQDPEETWSPGRE